eukprot:CAMPEP_0119084330 /NCGR_PEP_ID=MMETSP1178-20130426/129170_1 /TAXON_ID=33656 /ORGANISM="unid sp, Strain CCMP2000" /LENGTH=58 /DNA_ID=CAMNT_0007067291 /DNA_START=11 /DNA_END=183 /DNA_ORIENTATION=-
MVDLAAAEMEVAEHIDRHGSSSLDEPREDLRSLYHPGPSALASASAAPTPSAAAATPA